jgi:hypothetical protein
MVMGSPTQSRFREVELDAMRPVTTAARWDAPCPERTGRRNEQAFASRASPKRAFALSWTRTRPSMRLIPR